MKKSIQILKQLVKKTRKAKIITPTGKLELNGEFTFVMIVGPSFNQTRPDAMMTCRMGYCHAFEQLGVPYKIIDAKDIKKQLPKLNNPFCMLFAGDYFYINKDSVEVLKEYPTVVWVYPWFSKSKEFFERYNLDYRIWTLPDNIIKKVLNTNADFLFTATVDSGLHFFEEWGRNGQKVISLPLACDTTVYAPTGPRHEQFDSVKMAFVGGYWKSKGQQIDEYLKPFEDDLVIFGYSKWPYSGYRGLLSRELEPALYRQSLVSPTINEPTVALMHGQINERVFKILGSGGVTVVDAVPAYRELFSEEELLVPKDKEQFGMLIRELMESKDLREDFRKKGQEAVLGRHTYINRVKTFVDNLDSDDIQKHLQNTR